MAWSAPPSAVNELHGILLGCVHRELGSEISRELELVIDNINRNDPAAGDRRVLDSEMAETTDAEDGDEIGRPRSRDFHGLVCRHAGTGERCGIDRVDAIGDLDDISPVRLDVVGERAVERVAHVLLLQTERLPAAHAVFAGSAGIAEPGDRDAVADDNLRHAGSDLLDDPHAFVSGRERRCRLDGPVAVRGMDVRVAEAGGLDPDDDLTCPCNRLGDFVELKRPVEVVHNGGVHRLRRRAPRPLYHGGALE